MEKNKKAVSYDCIAKIHNFSRPWLRGLTQPKGKIGLEILHGSSVVEHLILDQAVSGSIPDHTEKAYCFVFGVFCLMKSPLYFLIFLLLFYFNMFSGTNPGTWL